MRESEVGGGGSGDFSLPFLETEFCALLLFGLPLSKLSDVMFFSVFYFGSVRNFLTLTVTATNILSARFWRSKFILNKGVWENYGAQETSILLLFAKAGKRERLRLGPTRGLTTITTLSFPVPRKEERRIENVRK